MSRDGRSSRANGTVATSEQPAAEQPPGPVVRRLGVRQLVVGLGDSARERTVLDAVGGSLGSDQEAEPDWSFQVVRRCVTARDLLETLERGAADVAVVGTDLHGLGLDAVRAVTHTRVPLVLVPAGPGEASWNDLRAPHLVVLPADAGPDQVRRALAAALEGRPLEEPRPESPAAWSDGRRQRPASPAAVEAAVLQAAGITVPVDAAATAAGGTLVVVAGPDGSPGRSSVAINVAAALGVHQPTVLVDANLVEPSLSVALDLNPALNVSMVVHEAPGADPARWAEALSGELQPLDASSPQAVVLCGAPKPGLRAALGTAFLEMLLQQLKLHYAWIVADLGDRLDEGSPAGAGHRAILSAADRVLVVATPDLVGLRRAASLLEVLRAQFGETASARVALVLNRHDRRHHHDPVDVAQALGVAVAAAIPDDRRAVQRALADQRPVLAFGHGRRGSAARALLDLAQLVERGSPGLSAAASGLPIVAAPAARVQERPPARSRWAWRSRVRLPWGRKGRPA